MQHPSSPSERDGVPGVGRLMGRVILITVGCIALVLGLLGIMLPLLPTTPLILLAAACFVGSWPAMHRRLARSRLFGPMVDPGPGGRYIPRRTKAVAITPLVLSLGASLVWVVEAPWVRITLAAVGVVVAGYLLWMPSAPAGDPPP